MLEYVTTHQLDFLSRWDIAGADRANTDHGRLYARLTGATNFTLTLYRDAARQQPVATGSLIGASGVIELVPVGGSGLTGTVEARGAFAGDAELDEFYASDADLTAARDGVADFLTDGEFAGGEGFSIPRRRAKRVLDALLNARLPRGWRADSLQPLAEPATLYALFFLYDYLSGRPGDPASQLALHFRTRARQSLGSITLTIGGRTIRPFTPRVAI